MPIENFDYKRYREGPATKETETTEGQQAGLESLFASKMRAIKELEDFFILEQHRLVDDQFQVMPEAHEKVLEAKEQGIEPLYMLNYDPRVR